MKIMLVIYQCFLENVCQVVHLYTWIFLASEMPIISYKQKKEGNYSSLPLNHKVLDNQQTPLQN